MNKYFKKIPLYFGCLVSVWANGQNISPANNSKLTDVNAISGIVFSWTPLSPKPKEDIIYRLKIWKLIQGQSGTGVMKRNLPIVTKDAENITQIVISDLLTGACKPQYQCDFIWNVEALSKNAVQGRIKSYGVSKATMFKLGIKKTEDPEIPANNMDIGSIVNKIKENKKYVEVKDLQVIEIPTHSLSEGRHLVQDECTQLFYPANGIYLKYNGKPIVFQFRLPVLSGKEKVELVLFKKIEFAGQDSARREFRQIHRTVVSSNKYQLQTKEPMEPGEYLWQLNVAGKTGCNTAGFTIASTPGTNCDSIRIDSIKCIGTVNNPDLRRVFATIVNCSPQSFDFNNASPLNNLAYWGFTSANQLLSSTTGTISNLSALPVSIPAYTSASISFDYTPVGSSTNIWIYDWLSYLSGGGLRLGVADAAKDTLMPCRCTTCDLVTWYCNPPSWFNGAFYQSADNSVVLIRQFCLNTSAPAGPILIKQLSAEITGFNFIPNDTNCLQCQNNNRLYGNFYDFQAPNTSFGIGTIFPSTGFNANPFVSPLPVTAHLPFYSRELIWQSLTGSGSVFNGFMFSNISLPPIIRNACCSADCDIWIRYTITKADCTVCSITYKYHFTIPHL